MALFHGPVFALHLECIWPCIWSEGNGPVFWLCGMVCTPSHSPGIEWLGIGAPRCDDPLVTLEGYSVAYARGLIGSWPSGQKEYASRRMADYSRGT